MDTEEADPGEKARRQERFLAEWTRAGLVRDGDGWSMRFGNREGYVVEGMPGHVALRGVRRDLELALEALQNRDGRFTAVGIAARGAIERIVARTGLQSGSLAL